MGEAAENKIHRRGAEDAEKMRTRRVLGWVAVAAGLLPAQTPASREEAGRALRKAVEFYRGKVSTEGGYHFYYAADLSYGRSEHGEGPTQIEVQREATPGVGMALLEAWYATGDRYYLGVARDAAYALVRGQLCSGGWDYIIEFDAAKRDSKFYRADGRCTSEAAGDKAPPTTLDDNTTQGALRLLMRVDRELGFQDAKIHDAAQFALDSLLKTQYPNGAWPQRYRRPADPALFPVKKASYPESWSWKWPGANYQTHYTFNDNTISDAIDLMLEAARIYNEPRYRSAAERGGGFILLAQMPEPQPGWAQQYDLDMHPSWARAFEPPSVTGGETQGILRTLMALYRETGDRKYLEPIPRALAWLQRSALPPAEKPTEARRRVRPPVLARFYELKTNKPLYVTKGSRASIRGGSSVNLDGYELSYSDESVITHYGVLTSGADVEAIARDYEQIAAADPARLRRPERLHGLSPWSERERPARSAAPSATQVRTMIDSMEARGAWIEDGRIGKADRLISLYAARDMVVSIGGRTYPVKENETVEVFQGQQPPLEKVIRSATFSRNVEMLSAYLSAVK